jgi:hypothetical protein
MYDEYCSTFSATSDELTMNEPYPTQMTVFHHEDTGMKTDCVCIVSIMDRLEKHVGFTTRHILVRFT